jgi:V8-like Glu-specific endopeptidase
MKRLIFAAVLLLALAAAPTASAITFGAPDGPNHPEVGALLNTQAYSDGTWAACSGTLISPTVFLTAAHCDLGVDRVEITFETDFHRDTGVTYWGDWHADPQFNQAQGHPHDIAVVVLDNPVGGITPAQLPTANSMANLAGNQKFTSVGYGGQTVTNGPGGKVIHYADTRYAAVGTLNSITKVWLRISQNPTRGDGGTCYGDSGGPNFLGAGNAETNIIAATTVTGDIFCRSTNVDFRLDTPVARAFLDDFVTLP